MVLRNMEKLKEVLYIGQHYPTMLIIFVKDCAASLKELQEMSQNSFFKENVKISQLHVTPSKDVKKE